MVVSKVVTMANALVDMMVDSKGVVKVCWLVVVTVVSMVALTVYQ